MLIGYVSDERYIALHDVQFELANENLHVETRSRATGEVFADIPPGPYTVTLQKDGFGPSAGRSTSTPTGRTISACSRISCSATPGPSGSKRAEQSEFRVHELEAYRLDLWRYGWQKEHIRPLGWFDEHGPRATMQITPDGDYTQTGVMWNKFGLYQPLPQTVRPCTGALWPLLLPRQRRVRCFLLLSLDRRPQPPPAPTSRCSPPTSTGTPTTILAGAPTTSTPTAFRPRRRSMPA